MDSKRNCTEQMRSILQAMERSIDSARRNRVGPTTPLPVPVRCDPPRPSFNNPPAVNPMLNPNLTTNGIASEQDPPRLKARPKRLDAPLVNPFEKTPYRSQAG